MAEFRLNDKIASLQPYDPIEGTYSVRLDANESFLPLREDERSLLCNAAKQFDPRRYPDPNAVALCRAAGAYYGIDPVLLTAGNGTDEILMLLCTAFLQAGDTFLCFEHDFSMYAFYAHLGGANVQKRPKRADFSIDVDAAVEALQTLRPAMLIFSNPCNPTSLVISKANVRRLITANPETLVVLDEAYMEFADESLLDEIGNFANLIILRTCSKAVGLAGLRLGFAVANKPIRDALHAIKSPYNVNALAQAIGTALLSQVDALRQGTAEIVAQTRELSLGLRLMEQRFPAIQIIGDSANFVFLALNDPFSAPDAFAFLKGEGIVVRCFGERLRVTAGSKCENKAFLCAFETYCLHTMNFIQSTDTSSV